jgi:EF hand
MFTTRRRFATLVSGSLAAAGVVYGLPALARGDDDSPPNVFFSPHGRPYRAPRGAPYPVVDWFKDADRNGDGKLDRDEFVADAAAFFAFLDLTGAGVLDTSEISFYEQRIAPEVLGMRVTVYADGRQRVSPDGVRLWRAQYSPDGGGPFGQSSQGQGPGGPGGPGQPGSPGQMGHSDPNEGQVVPQDAQPAARPTPDSETDLGTGASPYSLIREPEPVTASDPEYVIRAVVRKASFLAHAHDNFDLLDQAHRGYLTLASLPKSPVQELLERGQRRG